MESGRQLFERLSAGEPTLRPAFAPLLSRIVSRVSGVSLRDLPSDPPQWASALVRTAELLDVDGVAFPADASLLAEACGCPVSWEDGCPSVAGPAASLAESPERGGRLKSALDVAGRVFPGVRSRRGCVSVLTGPGTLATQLFGPDAVNRLAEVKPVFVRLPELLCAERPDMICLWEEASSLFPQGKLPPACRRVYNTIRNIASYYCIPLAVALVGHGPADLGILAELGVEIVLPGPSAGGELLTAEELLDHGATDLTLGLSLPLDDLPRAKELLAVALRARNAGRLRSFFLTGFEPATRDFDLEGLQQLTQEIRSTFA
ncbi:MAG: uroporphyrinogen decarboxylase family protein [Desulfobacteria bacterium]